MRLPTRASFGTFDGMVRLLLIFPAIALAAACWYGVMALMRLTTSDAMFVIAFWLSPWTFVGWIFALLMIVGWYKLLAAGYRRYRQVATAEKGDNAI